ncbi:SAP domain-containing protein [Micromonospora sp. NPDC023644]|uniref:SAP domain-containing protein n=1 Tax=Micromonospora sp. NPDC023644 TaxID=3154321 RepID=UPI00340E03BA
MGRFINSETGVVVSVADDKDERFASRLWSPYDGSQAGGDAEGAEGYDAMKVADLRAEIERRNEGRDEADLLSLDGRKPDLVAALKADDDARANQ